MLNNYFVAVTNVINSVLNYSSIVFPSAATLFSLGQSCFRGTGSTGLIFFTCVICVIGRCKYNILSMSEKKHEWVLKLSLTTVNLHKQQSLNKKPLGSIVNCFLFSGMQLKESTSPVWMAICVISNHSVIRDWKGWKFWKLATSLRINLQITVNKVWFYTCTAYLLRQTDVGSKQWNN